MQTEEIIRMAREADIEVAHMNKPMTDAEIKQAWLKRFSALVAAHEREACAKVCDDLHHWAASCCAKDIRARGE